jgi:serine/threonine-protein kinase
MALTPGFRLGAYEIVAVLGAGGMGEVYRATDTVLKRQVALKVLPTEVANDPERVARFQREAEVLASLNHPNIAHLYGLERSGGTLALVMELVEGPTLADRIAKGAIPLDEALPIAKQIAEALEAAHEQGIVHRDLKPANIKVREDGTVKVLDFGLAKALGPASGPSVDVTGSPTITTPAMTTGAGVILGTAAYMAPEQAKGRVADKRADVWAFGAVLYEMVTGRRCFDGDDVSEVFAAILRQIPDWSALPQNTPPPVHRLLRRCLERDVRSRLSDMAMVRVELREAEAEPAPVTPNPSIAAAKQSVIRRAATYAAVIVLAAGAWATLPRMRQVADAPHPVTRFSITLPDQVALTGGARNPVAISPDGIHLVYVANGQLYLRSIDEYDAAVIVASGTTGVSAPFFSPDGQWIGFWQSGQLRKVPIGGGAPVTIADAPVAPFGVSWESDGNVIMGLGAGGIASVPASGGTIAPLIPTKDGDLWGSPQLLPGSDWILFVRNAVNASVGQAEAVVQSRSSGERRVVVTGVREARYLASGHLVFGRGNALFAQPFDVRRLTLIGSPVPILDSVGNAGTANPATYYAVSTTGTLFYAPGTSGEASTTKLVAVARDGARTVLTDVPGMAWFPRFSPDGKRLAYGLSVGAALGDPSDLWVLDIERGARTRVTFTGNNRFYPIWTRDSTRLTHADGTGQTNQLLSTAADGSGVNDTLIGTGPRVFPSSWSPDGRVVALYINGPTKTRDVAMLSMTGDQRQPVPFVATPFEERGAIFSPNGKWIVYVSNKSGQNDVFARPYPGPGTEMTISAGGGQEPVWAPSGNELYYRQGDALQVVRIDGTGSELKIGAPVKVFDDPFRRDTGGAGGGMANYDIAPDGKRFVMVEEPKAERTSSSKLNVVVNWFDEVKRRAPAK